MELGALNKQFYTVKRMSMTDYITQKRVENAKRLIAQNVNEEEAALRSGFASRREMKQAMGHALCLGQ